MHEGGISNKLNVYIIIIIVKQVCFVRSNFRSFHSQDLKNKINFDTFAIEVCLAHVCFSSRCGVQKENKTN